MGIYSTVDCAEIYNTAQTSVGLDRNGARVALSCAWADRVALAQDLLNNRRVFPGFAGTGAPRVSEVQTRGWGEGTQNGQQFDFQQARVDVTYEPLAAIIPANPALDGYDLIIDSTNQTQDGLRLDHNGFTWDIADPEPNRLKPGEAPIRQVGRMTFEREFIGFGVIPTATLAYFGKTNAATFNSTLYGFSFPPETLLFAGMPSTRTIRTDGSDGWNVRFIWHYMEEGWNKYWRFTETGTGAWEGAYAQMYNYSTLAVYKNYPPVDMSAILF